MPIIQAARDAIKLRAWQHHVHAIVTGGGLALDGTRWCPSARRFLFPVGALSHVFRAKMMAALRRAYRRAAFLGFDDFLDPQAFDRLLQRIARLSWNVYAKAPFNKGRHVLDYLGRYTHRVGLANSRLLAVSDHGVTFRTKGTGIETTSPVEFLRRFVQHVLPDGLHKIRHVGLYASAKRGQLARQRLPALAPKAPPLPWPERFRLLTGRDLSICPHCGKPLVAAPLPIARAPPGVAA